MNKLLLTALTLLVGAVMSYAQGFRTRIPYTLENGKIIATAVINGIEGRFLIDTGAPCCVSHSFAQRAGIKPGTTQRAEDSNGQAVDVSLVRLDSLRLGRTTFRSLDAMQWEAGNPTEQFGIDGIIGYNLFRMGAIKFDTRRHLFFFAARAEALNLLPSCALPLLPDPYLVLVALPLRATSATANATATTHSTTALDTVMFDSGAMDFYEMSTRTYNRLHTHPALTTLASATGTLSMGAAGIERPSLKHRVKIGEIPLSGISFRHYATTTTDATLSRIGTDLFHYGDVAIDFRGQQFYFQPFALSDSLSAVHSPQNATASTSSTPPAKEGTIAHSHIVDLYQPEWDVVITLSPTGTLTAGIVWDNRLPISAGDHITAVNGQRFDRPLSLHEATTTGILSMPNNSATLRFLNKRGKEQTITIKKR